jgi:hypothetical protein
MAMADQDVQPVLGVDKVIEPTPQGPVELDRWNGMAQGWHAYWV